MKLKKTIAALFVGALLTVGIVIASGVTHFNAKQAFDFPSGSFHRAVSHGLGPTVESIGGCPKSCGTVFSPEAADDSRAADDGNVSRNGAGKAGGSGWGAMD